jgi:hypothetical protein
MTFSSVLAPLIRWLKTQCVAVVGNSNARKVRREIAKTRLAVEPAIATVARRWGVDRQGAPTASPVFICAAGWRSGSTWLQRLLMSSGQIIIWGEPFTHSLLIQKMSSQMIPISSEWPPDRFFLGEETPSELADEWVANLYPSVQALCDAHRAFFQTLFEVPVRQRQYSRWGLKEVRLTVDHALYLKFLFPDARFLFLIRNPFDAYQSYRMWGDWFFEWPHHLVYTAGEFGRVWNRLAQDFLQNYTKVGGLLLKYEDLVSGVVSLEQLSDYLGLPLDQTVAARRINRRSVPKVPIPAVEFHLLNREVRSLAGQLGYSPADSRHSAS